MSTAMTYQSLIQDVISYCERDDDPFVSQIPRLIMMTENRLASEIHGLGFLNLVTTTLNGPTLAKPDRWRETASFSITDAGSTVYLQRRGYQYCKAFNADGGTGIPRYYSDADYEHFRVSPAPDATYAVELSYYERPDPLTEVQNVNWTTQYAPQLLLYGALLEAMPFLKTGERIPEFQMLFDRAITAIAVEDQKRERPDAAAVRSKK